LIALPIAAAAAVLGWGWWQTQTHVDVHVAINDVALKTPSRRGGALESGTLVLRDERGQALAHAGVTGPKHLLEFNDAAAGDCGCFERQAPSDAAARAQWQACYAGRARWQAGWAGKAVSASVTSGRCQIDQVPVNARRYEDWWLWWVPPLSHVGGSACGYYAFELYVDSAACAAVNPGP